MITTKGEMVKSLKDLTGHRVLVSRPPHKIEMVIKSVAESFISQSIVQKAVINIVDTKGNRMPVELPENLDILEDGKVYVLDYNRQRNDEQKKMDGERSDRKFYEFLRAGKGHRFTDGGARKKPIVTIEVLD